MKGEIFENSTKQKQIRTMSGFDWWMDILIMII